MLGVSGLWAADLARSHYAVSRSMLSSRSSVFRNVRSPLRSHALHQVTTFIVCHAGYKLTYLVTFSDETDTMHYTVSPRRPCRHKHCIWLSTTTEVDARYTHFATHEDFVPSLLRRCYNMLCGIVQFTVGCRARYKLVACRGDSGVPAWLTTRKRRSGAIRIAPNDQRYEDGGNRSRQRHRNTHVWQGRTA